MSVKDGGGLGRAPVLTRRASHAQRLQAEVDRLRRQGAELEQRISVMNPHSNTEQQRLTEVDITNEERKKQMPHATVFRHDNGVEVQFIKSYVVVKEKIYTPDDAVELYMDLAAHTTSQKDVNLVISKHYS